MSQKIIYTIVVNSDSLHVLLFFLWQRRIFMVSNLQIRHKTNMAQLYHAGKGMPQMYLVKNVLHWDTKDIMYHVRGKMSHMILKRSVSHKNIVFPKNHSFRRFHTRLRMHYIFRSPIYFNVPKKIKTNFYFGMLLIVTQLDGLKHSGQLNGSNGSISCG